jgi:magnesium transporter
MPRPARKHGKKAGLPPGSLVYTGEGHTGKIDLRVFDIAPDRISEHYIPSVAELPDLRKSCSLYWLQVSGLDHVEDIAEIGRLYGLHPLVQEDIVNTAQRPKLEEIANGLFFDLNVLIQEDDILHSEQISLILGPNYVLSFEERAYDFFNQNRVRLRQEIERLPHTPGADHLAYILMDSIIDRYFLILETLEERIDDIEERLVDNPQPGVQQDIYHLKRSLGTFRKCLWPLRDIFNRILAESLPGIDEKTLIYYRDLHDHVIQILDTVDTLRDVVSGMLDIYLSSVSNRLNQIMKVLTIISTIFIPLSFIAGVYGMNFEHMPELHWRYGYFVIWMVMLTVGGLMLYHFKRKKWF